MKKRKEEKKKSESLTLTFRRALEKYYEDLWRAITKYEDFFYSEITNDDFINEIRSSSTRIVPNIIISTRIIFPPTIFTVIKLLHNKPPMVGIQGWFVMENEKVIEHIREAMRFISLLPGCRLPKSPKILEGKIWFK